ncbi:uncharacterized protein PHACADRAFT_257792 [Phanerochaete carnosa HHB-10118-sp]|uniref:Uncharacterized protein n=1 Tax=Phanerochaete carnosa (strain HHB-10118-sp) TaxID=650164 RepID=K5UVU2_PHACS|nr:uncharacterized protein PHACADRAFT_257792 [Phanerochaete carnosa HHB-10118-sp]EKM54156.1 hypothetical protein PHACADRAFT_257792 [Phanerochaete carnosa HHB-10118-sp]
MGQRGQLDRIPLAHNGPILALDWMLPSTYSTNSGHRATGSSGASQGGNWYAGVGSGLFDDLGSNPAPDGDPQGNGWLASGGLDRTVKVWDITVPSGATHIPRKPVYTMHTSFPVRRVAWRPGCECELAVTSYLEGSANNQPNPALDLSDSGPTASPRIGSAVPPVLAGTEDNKVLYSMMGDPVELWDVRRGYIAKWTVRGSAAEGGVTDIVFADSHTLWAEHFSGAFSQLDLRMSVKTLDAVPRASLSWDVSGSLAFVADRPKRWEVPYDDINPEKRIPKRKAKALGDKPYMPATQVVGMMAGHGLDSDVVMFVRLAQGYRHTGDDRPSVCTHNAEVALEAGKPDAAQTWLLLSSLLTDIVPAQVPTPISHVMPIPFISPRLPHSVSAPAAVPTMGQLLPEQSTRSFSADGTGTLMGDDSRLSTPPSRHSTKSRTYSSSTHSITSVEKGYLSPLRTTPVSSTTPSPHRPATPLPTTPVSVSTSAISRRSSATGATSNLVQPPMRARLGSSYRRPSLSAQTFQPSSSTADIDLRSSHSSLKYIGEGVLEDTDSEDGGDVGEPDDQRSDGGSDVEAQQAREDEDRPGLSRRPSRLPGSSYWRERSASTQPSPLSRVAGQQDWTEDERDEEDSPSPASTDNSDPSSGEHDGAPAYRRQGRHGSSVSRSRRSSMRGTRTKDRSRSATVASLTVSTSPALTPARAKLLKQESRSSIRTVTATPTPTSAHMPDNAHPSAAGAPRDGIRRVSGSSKYPASIASAVLRQETGRPASALSSNRRSGVFYDEDALVLEREQGGSRAAQSLGNSRMDQEYKESIQRTEARLREVGWNALRGMLEVLADEGDVQMCVMLSLVVPKELKIGPKRALRFIESYVELLTRMRLHSIAAYIRKYAEAEDLRNRTAVETTIHTVCRKCNKNLLGARPMRPDWDGTTVGSFAYCKSCCVPVTTCSICRLPVRALLFTCPVCMHGGHQSCYQQYYLSRPLVQISTTSVAGSDPSSQSDSPATDAPRLRRAASKTGDGEGSDDGASTRDGEEGSLAIRFPDSTEGKLVLSGYPCAAGCGHYCWATNDPFSHENTESET